MKRIHTDWGHLEAAVLAVVAAQGEAVTVTQVQAQLSGDPAYTTVMSTLSRLARKGALSRTLSGRAYRYELAAPEGAIDDAVTARQMRDLMSSGGHPDAVLARFVADLEPAEERLLAELLARSQEPADEPAAPHEPPAKRRPGSGRG